MPLNLNNRNIHSETVASVLRSLIAEQHGRLTSIRIPQGGKMEKACTRLVNFAHERKITLKELLSDILGLYGVDFCMRTFKTPYPQANVVLSDKAFERVKMMNKKPITVDKKNITNVISVYMDAMKDVDYKTAKTCVESGWPEGPSYIRTAILEALKRRERDNKIREAELE